ncbi:MAG: bacterial Ig-like domain-containing protein [Eubacterium sp.]|nr:bacterial Ig-like domain-containing protein [Eubacterium sp.]
MKKRILSIVLASIMVIGSVGTMELKNVKAEGENVLQTDVSAPRNGNVFLEVEGAFTRQEINAALDRINEIRYEACELGLAYPDEGNVTPSQTKTLTTSDYKPIKWSQGLERAAIIRAAEYSLMRNTYETSPSGHNRPNSTNGLYRTISSFNGTKTVLENLASGSYRNTLEHAIDSWYSEKDEYINQSGTYGHYQLMISPYMNYVGMANFYNPDSTYKYYTAGEFCKNIGANDTEEAFNYDGTYTQLVEVADSWIKEIDISGEYDYYNAGQTYKLKAKAITNFGNDYTATINSGVTWSTSDSSIATVDSEGNVNILKAEDFTITVATSSGNVTGEYEISPHVEGTTIDSIEELAVKNTSYNKAPSLPKTVKVNLTDSTSVDMPVVWDSYDKNELKTKKDSNEFNITGHVAGTTVTQKIHVNPQTFTIQEFTRTVNSGTKPIYTTGTAIIFEDDSSEIVEVTWNKTNGYMARNGGTYTDIGTFDYYYDGETRTFETKMVVTVIPATIQNVVLNSTSVTTSSGTEPIYPTARVTWSNREVDRDVAVEWEDKDPTDEDRKYMSREGGSYTLKGTCEEREFTLTVNVTPATAESATLSNDTVNVAYGENPTSKLPKTATVTWSNGDTTSENISWEEQSSADYTVRAGNEYNTTGTVCGKTVTAKVKVASIKMKSASVTSSVYTPRKKAPTLPSTARVTWADNSVTDEPVDWETPNSSQYATANTSFNVTGTVEGYDGDTKTVTTTVNVTERALTGIAWAAGSPTNVKSKYTYNPSDVKGNIVATYDNEDSETIAVNIDGTTMKLDEFNANSSAATQSVRLAYTEAGITRHTPYFNIQLITRTGIKISQYPKTTFIEGQAFSFSGIKLKSVLSDGTEEDANASLTAANFSGYNMNPTSYGKQTVTVTWGGKSCTYDITVNKKKLTGLTLVSGPSTTEYLAGIHQPSVDGIVVNGQYDNGTTSPINITASNLRVGCTAANPAGSTWNTSTAGTYDVYVVVQNDAGESIKTDSFKMYVYDKTVESISVKTKPTEISVPQNLVGFTGFADGVLTANCNCNYTEDISFSDAGVSILGFDISQIGEQTVTVSYGGKTTTFNATVTEPVLQSTTVTPPTKTSYTQGESVSMAGAKIVKTYDNGRTEEIDLSQSADALSTAGVEVVFRDAAGNEYPVNDASITTSTGAKTLVVKYKDPATGTIEELAMSNGAAVSVNVSQKPEPSQPSKPAASNNKSTGSTTGNSTGTTQKSSTPKSTTPKYKNEWRNGKWYGADGKSTYSGTLSWKSNSKGWWVEDSAGWYPQDQWQKIDGIWYYFKPDGYMASSEYYKGYWFNSDGSWDPQYKLSWKSNATGWWVEDISGWWPSNKWLKVDGDWYYFNGSGYMATSQYVDGYWLAANGVCQ